MDLYMRYHRPTHLVGRNPPVGIAMEVRARVDVTYGASEIRYISISIYLSICALWASIPRQQ